MNISSIRFTLTSLFSGLLLALLATGATGLWGLFKTSADLTEISTNWLPSVDITRKLATDFNSLRLAQGTHIMSTDETSMLAIEKTIDETNTLITQDFSVYDKLISSDDERANLVAIKSLWQTYLSSSRRVQDLSRANKNAEATDLFKAELASIASSLEALLGKAVKINVQGANQQAKEAQVSFDTTLMISILAVIAGATFAIWSTFYSRTKIIVPLADVSAAMSKVSSGDLASGIPHVQRQDEIGDMSRALQTFKEGLIRAEELRSAQAKSDAERHQRQLAIEGAIRSFEGVISQVVTSVETTSGQLQQAATALTETASTSLSLSTTVASAAEQTSANVQGVAAAAEELSSTVTEIGRQVQESSSIASVAVTQAADTNSQVQLLTEAAQRIGDVVSLINSIAGQTNLLALNATIEAARAGEAGKGFAVVAQEVKALAEQTGKATNEIASQIASMQSATASAAGAIDTIAATINRISEVSGAIAAAVEEQDATTKEISRNVIEAAKGTSEVAKSITEVSQGADQTGSASAQVLASAQHLARESNTLKASVDQFFRQVRAA